MMHCFRAISVKKHAVHGPGGIPDAPLKEQLLLLKPRTVKTRRHIFCLVFILILQIKEPFRVDFGFCTTPVDRKINVLFYCLYNTIKGIFNSLCTWRNSEIYL